MKERRLTVGYIYANNRKVPSLRLSGRWLESLGFEFNQKVIIRQTLGQLTIQLIKEAETCK